MALEGAYARSLGKIMGSYQMMQMLPSMAVTPEQLGMTDQDSGDPLEYVGKLLSEAFASRRQQ